MAQEQGNGDASGFSIIAEKTIPETYADSAGFRIGLYGISLEFGIIQATSASYKGRAPIVPRVRVHMSPQHAKVMAKLFVRNMQTYEETFGRIQIPKAVLDELQLSEEW